MSDLIDRQAAIVAVKDALLAWSYMPEWRDDKIVDAVIGVESATDKNVGTKLSTNLAEVGRDCISRQAAIDALIALTVYSNKRDLVEEADNHPNTWIEGVAECIDEIEDLPSAQPEIIRCKDCKYAEYIDDVKTLWCTECGQGRTVAPNDFCSYAEKREVTECLD